MCLRKSLMLAVCVWIGCSFFTIKNVKAGVLMQEKRMIVTAYYKPLPQPHQKEYVVSYSEDVRVNGMGEKTKIGLVPRIGTVAADPRFFSEGKTDVYIPGYGSGKIEDSGSNIVGPKRLDIFMGEGDIGREKAITWGVKEVDVIIITYFNA